MRLSGIASGIAYLSLLIGGGHADAFSGQDTVQLKKPLQYEVAVTVKLVQVYVTDKNGKPVANLDKSEFRVFDNGKLQTITEFERHTAPLEPAAGLPPEKGVLAPTGLAAPRISRKFFVFIDVDNNNFEGLNKSKAAAVKFLDNQILPSDEIGVLSYSFIEGLALRINLTTDHAKVREAVQSIRVVPGKEIGGTGGADTGKISSSPIKLLIRGETEEPDMGTNVTSSGGSGNRRTSAQGSTSPSRVFADRMTALAKVLAQVTGYKNILYFSQGGFVDSGDRDSVRRLEDMCREFGAANAPLYTINSKIPDPFFMGGPKPPLGGEGFLGYIAEKSGGKAYKEEGSISHFADISREIQDLTRNYYVLGFPVRASWDGKFHKIKVEMRSGDYRIQAQSGYYNPKLFKDFSDLEKEIHLFDLALVEKPAAQAPLMFAMRALHFESGDEARVLMLSKLPAEVIDRFAGKNSEVVSLIFDEQDNPVERKQIKPELAKYKGTDIFYSAEAPLKPGAYRCRIIVRDLDTGEAAMAYARASVPAKTGAGLNLYSPLLLISKSGFVYRDLGTKKDTAPWMDCYSYDRSLYAPLVGELPQGTSKIYAVIPASFSGPSTAEPAFSATLVDSASGRSARIAISIANKFNREGLDIFLAEVTTEAVPAGKYLLYFHAEDAAAKPLGHVQISLSVK